MGRQNDALVAYLNREEILADLYNGCLCGGKQVVTVKTLGEAQRVYRERAPKRRQSGAQISVGSKSQLDTKRNVQFAEADSQLTAPKEQGRRRA